MIRYLLLLVGAVASAIAVPAWAQVSPDEGAWTVKGDLATVTASGIGIAAQAGVVSLTKTGEASLHTARKVEHPDQCQHAEMIPKAATCS